MIRVAAVGEAMIELSMGLGNSASVGVAGDTLNAGVYMKRTAPAIEVSYITCLGDDPFSDKIAGFISAQGIGTDKIERLSGRMPGLYAITTQDDGERSFSYWRGESAARRLFNHRGALDFSVLEGFDLVYLSGISVAVLPNAVRLALLDWLKTKPVRLAYDSNYRPRLWENKQTAQDVTAEFWSRADICLPSVDDEMDLFDETEATVTSRFAAKGATGALKRGARGPVSLGEKVSQIYPPADKVIDTTAAGDSFNGAYLGAILSGAPQSEALAAGHDCARRVVGFKGAIVSEES